MILITYGDLITSPQKKTLRALSDSLTIFMGSVINTVHILPFFPSSSDPGGTFLPGAKKIALRASCKSLWSPTRASG